HFLRPILPGEAQIETRVERAGRRLTTVTARFLQGERPAALAIGTLGTAIPAPLSIQDLTMPEAPPPDAVPSRTATFGVPFGAFWDHRPTLGDLPYAGAPSALLGGWVRLREPAPIDAPLVAAMTDCYPPPILNRMRARVGLVPTVDLTIHLRRDLPLPGLRPEDYCFALFGTQTVADGYLEEDGAVWAPDGRLLAQSRQLAILG
ncbi:MAG: thioesterase family protein, partial [Candidatus Dormiibacterota bacterium]